MKADIYELKTDVINLFARVLALITNAGDNFHKEYQEKLNLEISKIESLELRMTITAPMKAGKSTIVNSLVGREILPNRSRAMTTIPTEIVLTPNLNESILKISNDSIQYFKESWNQLKKKINSEEKFKDAENKISSYDHLNPLLTEIRDALEFPIHLTTQGDEQIRKSLEKLNDLIRLCSIIAPHANPLSYLSDIPRIETPLLKIRDFKSEEMLGKLVIVDTPGPNEVGDLKLAEVVKKELNISSLVLLVLDYQRLDEQIADEIRQDVQNTISSFSNEQSNLTKITSSIQDILKHQESKKLYILVNRIDQRKTKSKEEIQKDKENIKNFVYSRYRLSEVNNPNQLFEISAIKALRTTQLLLEMREYPNKDISDLESLIPFLKESCGDAWEIMQNHQLKTKEDLKNFAYSDVWKNSGFGLFLENAIDDLTLKAAPICIENTLTNTLKILFQWQNPLILRRKANHKNKEEIESAIKLLENYLDELKNNFNPENIFNELKIMRKEIEKEINIQLEEAKKKSEKSLRDFFLDKLLIKFRENNNIVNSFFQPIDLLIKRGLLNFSVNMLGKIVTPIIKDFLDFLDDYFNGYIPASVLTIIKYKVVLQGVNEVYFENQEEAEEFRDSVTADACTIFNKHLNNFVSEGNKIINLNQEEIETSLINKTQKSLKKVLDYLNDKFDVGLKLPMFIEESIVYNNSSTIITISERKKILLQRVFDWIRGRISDKKISPNIFCISLKNMVDEMNVEFDNQFREIQQSMFNFVTNELSQPIDEFSANLQKKMKSLQEALEQSLVDKLQKQKDEEDLMIMLDNLVNSSNEYITDIQEKIQYIQNFKGGK